jgi:hypothetical protein
MNDATFLTKEDNMQRVELECGCHATAAGVGVGWSCCRAHEGQFAQLLPAVQQLQAEQEQRRMDAVKAAAEKFEAMSIEQKLRYLFDRLVVLAPEKL